MKFIEEKLEKAFTALLGQEGYPHPIGISNVRKPNDIGVVNKLPEMI